MRLELTKIFEQIKTYIQKLFLQLSWLPFLLFLIRCCFYSSLKQSLAVINRGSEKQDAKDNKCFKMYSPSDTFCYNYIWLLSYNEMYHNFGYLDLQIMKNFTSVHLSYVELKHMGQQQQLGRYPVHFHLCGDVDYKGGYRHATSVDGLSIHHSFSRCITVHGTDGLLVSSLILC